METMKYKKQVEKWDVFEVEFQGPATGNPFTDYEVTGTFESKNECTEADGFYDGEGIYKLRFMPSFEEEYTFRIHAGFLDSDLEGSFTATAPGQDNHGPVRVANTYHFAYEDGTPYYSVGTTCYVWDLQSDELIGKTLKH